MQKGDIVLIPFPFTDMTGNKKRPALILISGGLDVTVSFISTQLHWKDPTDLLLQPDTTNGLKKPSLVRIGKIATIDKALVIGKMGNIDAKEIEELDKIIMTKILPLLFVLLIAISCQNDKDTVPTLVLGTWEMVGYNDYVELDFATTYHFKADGTYTYSSTLREKGSDLDLGFNFLETGTFRSENNVLKLVRNEFLHKPYGGEKLFYTTEELDSGHIGLNKEHFLHYELRNNGSTFFIPGGIVGGDGIVPDRSFIKRN